jgi:hypothetical protein
VGFAQPNVTLKIFVDRQKFHPSTLGVKFSLIIASAGRYKDRNLEPVL